MLLRVNSRCAAVGFLQHGATSADAVKAHASLQHDLVEAGNARHASVDDIPSTHAVNTSRQHMPSTRAVSHAVAAPLASIPCLRQLALAALEPDSSALSRILQASRHVTALFKSLALERLPTFQLLLVSASLHCPAL